MNAPQAALGHLLGTPPAAAVDFARRTAADCHLALRLWNGSKGPKFRKDQSLRALEDLFRDTARVAARYAELPPTAQQILRVFQRYGGGVPGTILFAELKARGLIESPPRGHGTDSYARWRAYLDNDPVKPLRQQFLLLGPYYIYYDMGASYGSIRYPELAAAPHVLDRVTPAPPLPWKASRPTPAPPGEGHRRAAADVALDFCAVAQELAALGHWKLQRGGTPPKPVRTRLAKLFPAPTDKAAPPDPETLVHELLRGMRAIDDLGGRGEATLYAGAVDRHLRAPAAVQGWQRVRAWLDRECWQDGIGLVPDRDNESNPVRIRPSDLGPARQRLVWGLTLVAHGSDEWLDLETFLLDLYDAAVTESHFYWGAFSWDPKFATSQTKESHPAGPVRSRAFWLDMEGEWAANAIAGTFVFLGLVERAEHGGRHCFRLTPEGRAVFGAPDLVIAEPPRDPKFLTVQPNYEILAYLDEANAAAVWPLARVAKRTSPPGRRVATFALTRDSVYSALESGQTVEGMRVFLRTHSKSGLPENVAVSLAEWGRSREALVLRTGVALAAAPPGAAAPHQGKEIGDGFVALSERAARGWRADLVCRTTEQPALVWRPADEFTIHFLAEVDSVARARLGQFAEVVGDEGRLTAASLRRAKERGVTAEQVLYWLEDHLIDGTPPLTELFVRNWLGGGRAFLGSLVLFQTDARTAAALMGSDTFRPLLLGQLAPEWLVVREEKRTEFETLAAEMGFAVHATPKL